MKTLLILWICLFTGIGFVQADDDRPITVDELPQKSLEFIRKYFPQNEISFAKEERDFWDKKYEVVFVNGEKIEFSKNGEWKEVKCQYSTVPEAIVPQPIKDQLAKQHPEAKVLKIERDKKGYEIKLSNRMELKYNTAYLLVDIDD